MNQSHFKLGFKRDMVDGRRCGMVGGGIFSTPGVVVGIAGAGAWLSYATAGLTALPTGDSYVKLAANYGLEGRRENTQGKNPAPWVQ